MLKSLDRKLAAIHADPTCREFILADAKDADMAFGIGAPGLSPESHPSELRYKTLRNIAIKSARSRVKVLSILCSCPRAPIMP